MASLVTLETDEGVLHTYLGGLVGVLEWAAAFIDLFAIAVLLVGAVRFMWGCAGAELFRRGLDRVHVLNRERLELGRYILAGLELFIVSDVIHTALSLKLSDLLFLGILVLIRSVISFFLEREIKSLKEEVDT